MMAKNWFQKELEKIKGKPEYHVFNLTMDLAEGMQKAMAEQGLNRNQLAKKLGVNRVEQTGTSFHGETALDLFSWNRAGPNESTLNEDGLYAKYCAEGKP